jgi:hypothetical protein
MNFDLENDYETPVEELPGILAYTWDYDFFPIDECTLGLVQFNDTQLSEDLHSNPGAGNFVLKIGDQEKAVSLDPDEVIISALKCLPAISVVYDPGPSNAGPASGAGNLIFVDEEHSYAAAAEQIKLLVQAMESRVKPAP